jgi:hypothetical protein
MRTKIRLAVLAAVGAVCLAVPIVATGATGISGHLTGSQVVNPNGGDPNGTANLNLRVNRQKARVCFVLTYKKLSGHVTGAFIHKGDEGRSPGRSSPCSRAITRARSRPASTTSRSASSSA